MDAMTTSDTEILSALVDPIGAGEFLSQFWPDEAFVSHGPLARLPAAVRHPALASFAALAARYEGRILFGRGRKGPRAIPVQNVAATDLYEMGLSLYLPDIEPIVPDATPLLRSLERALGLAAGEARITAWASPEADGIACHLDPEEVFSIQLVGTKRFHVAEPAAMPSPVGVQYAAGAPPDDIHYPQAPNGFPEPDNGQFSTLLMEPGSVMFLPRGHWHWTEADTDSLSVSIVLSPAAPVDHLLSRLRPLLLQDPRWRRPSYGPGDDARLRALLDELPRIARRLTPADLGDRHSHASDELPRFQAVPGAGLDAAGETPDITRWIAARPAAFSRAQLAADLPHLAPDQIDACLRCLVSEGALKTLAFDDLAELRARPARTGEPG